MNDKKKPILKKTFQSVYEKIIDNNRASKLNIIKIIAIKEYEKFKK